MCRKYADDSYGELDGYVDSSKHSFMVSDRPRYFARFAETIVGEGEHGSKTVWALRKANVSRVYHFRDIIM